MTRPSWKRRGIACSHGPWPADAALAKTTSRPENARQRSEQLTERFAEFGGGLPMRGRPVGAGAGRAVRRVQPSGHAAHPRARGAAPSAAEAAPADDHQSYLDRLLEGEPTPPRPTSDYQALLGEGPHDDEATNPGTPAATVSAKARPTC